MSTRNLCRCVVFLSGAAALLLSGSAIARADDPNAPPVITQHPVSQTVCEGGGVIFTVVATGEGLSYQWRKDEVPIDGATIDTLTFDAVTVSDGGDYDVVVSNPHGSVTSEAATLTVDTGPEIVGHPTSQTVCQGVNVTLTVVATGIDLGYQWRKDDEPIDGATSDTLSLDAVTVPDSGDYDVVVTNPCGAGMAISNAAALLVDPGPQIVEQPESQEVCAGASVTLSVSVSNELLPQQDTVGSMSSSGSGARMRGNYYRVTRATMLTRIEQYLNISTSGLLVFFVYEADNLSGPYALAVEDVVPDSGTGRKYYSSSALAVPLQAGKYYIIGGAWPGEHTYYWNYSHPNATTFGVSLHGFAYAYQEPLPDPPPANTNSSAYMQRLTTSDLAMSYQWRKDDEDIPGAGGPQYTIPAMSSNDVGDYQVLITNQCGAALSDTAALTLSEGVTITQSPANTGACVGEPATFTVVADGPDLTYQWRKGGEDIADATADAYTIEAVTLADAGDYDVVVSNFCATVTSAAATLTVADTEPLIVQQPSSQGACEGDEVTFTVVAEGAGLQYQWRKDGADIQYAHDASYTISAADPNDGGVYDVLVSNPCGSLTSETASLLVDEALSITEQPIGEVLCEGSGLALTVVVAGANVSYQWRKDGEDIPGATSDTYIIGPATLDDSGSYDVVVTNNCGQIVSDAAMVTVVAGPVIDQQPADRCLLEGEPLTLAVVLDLASFPDDVDTVGRPAVWNTGANKIRGNSYAVQHTTTLARIEHYLDITTAGEILFFVYESEESEQGPYTLILEDPVTVPGNGLGFYASDPLELTLEAGKYYIIGAAWRGSHTYYWEEEAHPQTTAFGPSVHGYATTYQSQLPYQPVPSSENVYCQRLTTVQRVASYQWRKDGAGIPDATADTYCVDAVTFADGGDYDVVIANVCGTVFSDPARVVVIPQIAPAACTPVDSPQAPAGAQPKNPDP